MTCRRISMEVLKVHLISCHRPRRIFLLRLSCRYLWTHRQKLETTHQDCRGSHHVQRVVKRACCLQDQWAGPGMGVWEHPPLLVLHVRS